MRAKQVLCFNSSRIKGEELVSKIHLRTESVATTAVGSVVVNSLFVATTKSQCQGISFYNVGFFFQSCF